MQAKIKSNSFIKRYGDILPVSIERLTKLETVIVDFQALF